MLSTIIAGSWQAAAYTVTYPLWRMAKSPAHIAEYLSSSFIKCTLNSEGRVAAAIYIYSALLTLEGKVTNTSKNPLLIPEMWGRLKNYLIPDLMCLKKKLISALLFPGDKRMA